MRRLEATCKKLRSGQFQATAAGAFTGATALGASGGATGLASGAAIGTAVGTLGALAALATTGKPRKLGDTSEIGKKRC